MNRPRAPFQSALSWAWSHKLLMLPIVATLALSVCAGFVGLIYFSALGGLRNHPLYQQTLLIAAENAEMQQLLGTPIDAGFITDGTIEIDDENTFGRADITIPVSGPQGTGRLLVDARLVDGEWIIDELIASMDAGRVLKLVEKPTE